MEDILLFQQSPVVTFATNTFINVPVILQYEETPLIETIHETNLGFMSQVSIYHSDGTYLAKAKGPRLYLTQDGEKANLNIRNLPDRRICELNGNTLFELRRTQPGWEVDSELYTPEGTFIKSKADLFPEFFNQKQQKLQVRGITMQNCTFTGVSIGILVKADGSVGIGVSKPRQP